MLNFDTDISWKEEHSLDCQEEERKYKASKKKRMFGSIIIHPSWFCYPISTFQPQFCIVFDETLSFVVFFLLRTDKRVRLRMCKHKSLCEKYSHPTITSLMLAYLFLFLSSLKELCLIKVCVQHTEYHFAHVSYPISHGGAALFWAACFQLCFFCLFFFLLLLLLLFPIISYSDHLVSVPSSCFQTSWLSIIFATS